MVTTPLSKGFVYILNWAPSSDDPENYDLDGKTAGTDYIALDIIDEYNKYTDSDKTFMDFPGGTAYRINLSMFHEEVQLRLREPDRATVKLVEKYVNATALTQTDSYLVIKHGSNDYEEFTDADGNRQEFLVGDFEGGFNRRYIPARNCYDNIMLIFRGVQT
jgi:hypothetical protein